MSLFEYYFDTIHKNRLSRFNKFCKYLSSPTLTNKQKGDLFEVVCYYVFKLHPQFGSRVSGVWLLSDTPQSILTKLNLPSVDKGIDLIVEMDNRYYGVQAKYRADPNTIVNWGELSTFAGLTFGVGEGLYKGILITNTYDVCDELLNDRFIVLNNTWFQTLPPKFFSNTIRLIRAARIKIIKKSPYDYQTTIINQVAEYLKDNSRCTVQLACGTGKSLISLWITRQLKPTYVCVLVPSLYLLSQFYNEWVGECGAPYLLVGSDADIERQYFRQFELSTDKVKIAEWMRDHRAGIVISTYQSSALLGDHKFDLIVYDEAHKTTGQSSSLFTRSLGLQSERKLFMTATTRVYNGPSDDFVGMQDDSVYGPQLINFDIRDAIKINRLTDYDIVCGAITTAEAKKFIANREFVGLSDLVVDAELVYRALLTLDIIRRYGARHILTYHNSVVSAKAFKRVLAILDPKLTSYHINGDMPMQKRNRIVRDFESSECAIMCSARVLNEGVNIPIVDCVVFIEPRKSTIDIVQCVGRCLRKCVGKSRSYVVVPVLIDDIDTDGDTDGEFTDILTVIRAIAEHDTVCDEFGSIRSKVKFVGFSSTTSTSEKEFTEIDTSVWALGIESRIITSLFSWETKYQELREYIEKNDKLPSSKDSKNASLGSWCSSQRMMYKKNKLSSERITKLESLNGWMWDVRDEEWNNIFDELKEYFTKNNYYPSRRSKDSKIKNLGEWCKTQSKMYKKNKLSEERITQLESLKDWMWNIEVETWNNNFNELKEYIVENSNYPSISSKEPKIRSLGLWCHTQRGVYKKNKLSDERITHLESLNGWMWDVKTETWNNTFNELKEYLVTNTNYPSQNSKDPIVKSLGLWCGVQRREYKKSKISEERIKQLESLKGWMWDVGIETWNNNFNELKKYIAMNSNYPSPYSKNPKIRYLGLWCGTQRVKYKKNKMESERITQLESLKGWRW